MSNEDAIRELKILKSESTKELTESALELAIKALEVEPKLSEKKIEEIADLLETEWGYEGIREDVKRILNGEE